MGDAIARALKVEAFLYSMTLTARGTGTVGEMTTLITSAFNEIREFAANSSGTICILHIDEADALAQSREFAQMHHEDRAGVNALIRGIDQLTDESLPVLVVMCTNRLNAIDPAIQRRAAATYQFHRPNATQRQAVLGDALAGAGLDECQLKELAELSGPSGDTAYGFTYSDLTQRFLPGLVIEAFPDRAIDFQTAKAVLESMTPTKPFETEQG